MGAETDKCLVVHIHFCASTCECLSDFLSTKPKSGGWFASCPREGVGVEKAVSSLDVLGVVLPHLVCEIFRAVVSSSILIGLPQMGV